MLAAVALAAHADEGETKTARKRIANEAVKHVAEYLNNTPAVCRAAYIDPRVFDAFDSGQTIRTSLKRLGAATEPAEFVDREAIERAVRKLLK